MGKYITIDGEQIPLEQDSTVRDVKQYHGTDDDTVLIYRDDDGDTLTLTDSDIVLEHIPNKSEATLQPASDHLDDDFHVIYGDDRYFIDPAETAGDFKDRVGLPNSDILTFRESDDDDFERLDDNVVLADNVESGATIATFADSDDQVWG